MSPIYCRQQQSGSLMSDAASAGSASSSRYRNATGQREQASTVSGDLSPAVGGTPERVGDWENGGKDD